MIVVWRVTTACNLDCPFCAYAKSERVPRRDLVADQALHLAPVLRAYARAQAKPVLVSWLGGEPLLWPAVFEVSHRLRSEYGLRIGITTNGTGLCSDASIERANDCFDEVTFSIDGLAETHERLRGWPGGYEKLRQAVLRLDRADHRPLIRINTVLMKGTIEQFPALCEELASWGVDEITFNQLGGNDRPSFYREHRLEAQQIAAFAHIFAELRQKLAQSGVRLAGGPRYLQRFVATAANQALAVDDCDPGNDFLFVDELGRVAPCSFTVGEYAVPIETLDSLASLLALRSNYRARIAGHRSRWCLDCQSTRIFNKFVA